MAAAKDAVFDLLNKAGDINATLEDPDSITSAPDLSIVPSGSKRKQREPSSPSEQPTSPSQQPILKTMRGNSNPFMTSTPPLDTTGTCIDVVLVSETSTHSEHPSLPMDEDSFNSLADDYLDSKQYEDNRMNCNPPLAQDQYTVPINVILFLKGDTDQRPLKTDRVLAQWRRDNWNGLVDYSKRRLQ